MNNSEGVRIEQVREGRRTEDPRVEERRRQDNDEKEAQVIRRATEEEQGGNIDITA
ncbi:MAG: hypothetical protein JW913_08755 [Chitinispirillaceae bacterium]|nr:hypothetical protein [Chitinispirillaceae bacterium]